MGDGEDGVLVAPLVGELLAMDEEDVVGEVPPGPPQAVTRTRIANNKSVDQALRPCKEKSFI